MSSALPDGFHIRAPTRDDLDELAALLVAHDRARAGAARLTAAAARAWIVSLWETPGVETIRDARVAIAPSGAMAGSIMVWRPDDDSGYMVASPRILPAYQPLGLDAALLVWAEALAREKAASLSPQVAATLNAWVDGPDSTAEVMLTRAGFTLAQRYLRMEITLHTPLPAPEWPDGVVARPFVAGQDERAVFDLMLAAFNDTPSYHPWPFEEWSRDILESESSDPSLWTLAAAGDHLVGAVINRLDTGDDGVIGWLEDVGVHPAWRKRGLGLAMLYQSFTTFSERGVTRCGLSVDIRNASGATRLYERAGMKPQLRQEIRYEKSLRR